MIKGFHSEEAGPKAGAEKLITENVPDHQQNCGQIHENLGWMKYSLTGCWFMGRGESWTRNKEVKYKLENGFKTMFEDFFGGPAVKTSPSSTGDMGFVSDLGAKILLPQPENKNNQIKHRT